VHFIFTSFKDFWYWISLKFESAFMICTTIYLWPFSKVNFVVGVYGWKRKFPDCFLWESTIWNLKISNGFGPICQGKDWQAWPLHSYSFLLCTERIPVCCWDADISCVCNTTQSGMISCTCFVKYTSQRLRRNAIPACVARLDIGASTDTFSNLTASPS